MCFFGRKKILAKQEELLKRTEELSREITNTRDSVNQTVKIAVEASNGGIAGNLKFLSDTVDKLSQSNLTYLTGIKDDVSKNLTEMRADNEKRLTEMRCVVEEKMTATLNSRISETFKTVSDRLDALNKSLGEMQTLTGEVTDLKKILGNVKTRGTFGEVGLANILSDVMTEGQYKEQFNLTPKSTDGRHVVDFAIALPGQKNCGQIYLPIDSKFPTEDYRRLLDATDKGDAVGVAEAEKSLFNAVKVQAKSIRDNYIIPPVTVDFALMYLPTEGLYAEVVRNGDLLEELRTKFGVVPVGPTTVTALLNSLALGFRTLAIQKSSREVYDILKQFKKDFGMFNDLIGKAQNQIRTATNTLDDATKRTTLIIERLNKVEKLEPPPDESLQIE
jgi:DNA recombination protein RmuC